MDVSFHAVGEGDLEDLNEIVNEPEVARYLELIPPVPMKKTVDFAAHMRSIGGRWWTIRVDGGTVGGIGIIPNPLDSKLAHVATFFIYLREEVWNTGLGGKSMEYLVSEARKLGLKRLECVVVRVNERAIRLYERYGFEIEGCRRDAFRGSEGFTDLLQMGLLMDRED